jgi:predicted ATPase
VKVLPELAQSVSGLAPTPALEPEAEKRRLFETLARFLVNLTATSLDAPALLVLLEDLHWSDATSLDFLHFFARRLSDFPILVLATYRRDEVSPSLTHLLAQLDRERLAEEIALHPLARDDVAAMVRAIFDIHRPIKADFLDLVMPLPEGNPFFIEEILKALVEAGGIFFQEGRWERRPAPELHIPRSVHDAMQRRLRHLSSAARRSWCSRR